MIEIERKFLVKSQEYKDGAISKVRIVQGFLNRDPERTVRVRTKGHKGFITVKGKSSQNGVSRFEWEKEIPLEDAKQLLSLCESGIIEKVRYVIRFGNHFFEVDEFEGMHKGLVIAEIELQRANENFTKPHWLGEEVTGDIRYYNSELSKKRG